MGTAIAHAFDQKQKDGLQLFQKNAQGFKRRFITVDIACIH